MRICKVLLLYFNQFRTKLLEILNYIRIHLRGVLFIKRDYDEIVGATPHYELRILLNLLTLSLCTQLHIHDIIFVFILFKSNIEEG
jgi:hypothetical protein